MSRRIFGLTLTVIVLAALAATPSAAADGLPIPGVIAPSGGVPGPDGTHYLSQTKNGATTIRELGPGGNVVRSTTVRGSFTIPAVALDGTPGGLAADGTTLALIKPRRAFPQSATHLLIVDATRLAVLDRLTLHGDFSFDAVSPDGSRLYFIQYLSSHDLTRYAVRAYDVQSSQLLSDPIVDPNEESPGEMRGYPLTRVMSLDGHWAYTLYNGSGKHPFVHALDTAQGRAVCIDLPASAIGGDLYGSTSALTLSADGGQLTVSGRGHATALIDTKTFEVSDPSAPLSNDGGRNGVPWTLIALAAAALLLAAGTLSLIRRRRGHHLAAEDA